MVEYKYEDLYYQDSVDKQLKIEVEDGNVITNEDIFSESMTLTESLCSDSNLTFGSCEASKFEIKIANQFYSMKGLWLEVSETLNGNEDEPFVFGRYKVESDRPTADRSFREIVAYDALYDIINADAIKLADWYNTIFPTLYSTMTLKEFRDSFFENFDIEQEETSLPNDNMIVERTIDTASITGKDLITAICEVNGCFGHMGRDGKFHYIFLPEIIGDEDFALGTDGDTFLASTDEEDEEKYFLIGAPFGKYARDAVEISKENWKSIDYEDYMTQPIDSLQLRDSTDDIGYVYNFGESGNNYVIENNFLLYGKSTEDFYNIAINIFDRMSVVSYRPTNADLRGNPCFEVGDPIMLVSKYKTICTYILSRTLTGIQALNDNYVSTGDETYDNSYNGSSSIIDQLKGISNVLERNVESNTVRISNLDGEYTEIIQTINSISFTVTGGLGGTASIVMKVGDEALTGDIDLSNVREAFAEDDTSIEISAGTILFSANTFLVDSNNLIVEADGSISASDATFTGSMMSIDGDFEVGVSNGFFRIYYNEIQMGNIRSGFLSGTDYRGFTINVVEASYAGFAINDTLYYILNNGVNLYSTQRHQFSGGVYFESNIYFRHTYGVRSYFSNGDYDVILFVSSEDHINVGNSKYTTNLIGENIFIRGNLFLQYGASSSTRYNLYFNNNARIGSWNSGSDWGWSGGNCYSNTDCGLSLGNQNLGSYLLRVNGEAYASGGWAGTSDETKKSEIKPLAEKTDSFIDKLNPVSFNFKDDEDKKIHFGVTSQNVKEALEAEGIDPDESGLVGTALDEDGNEFGTLYYDELIAPLIYEVKELKSELKELKESVAK